MSYATIEVPRVRNLVLTVENDPDCRNPLTDMDGMWTVYTWRHKRNSIITDTDFEEFFPQSEKTGEYVPTLAIRNKLRAGTAFFLDYYDYTTRFTVAGHEMDPYDADGIVVWEHPVADMGAKTVADRRADAASCLEVYSDWADGNCFQYDIQDENGDTVDACSGFYGTDHLTASLVYDVLPDLAPCNLKIEGEGAWAVDTKSLGEGIAVVNAFAEDDAEDLEEEYRY